MNEVEQPPTDLEAPRELLDGVLSRREFHQDVEPQSTWLQDLLEQLFGSMGAAPDWLGTAITGAIIATALAFVLYLLIDGGAFRRRVRVGSPESLDDEASGGRANAASWYRHGKTALEEGRFSEAIILLFRGMVARLTERGLLLDDPSRTNREHLRDLGRRPDDARVLRAATLPFELVRYGDRSASGDDARAVYELAQRFFPEEVA